MVAITRGVEYVFEAVDHESVVKSFQKIQGEQAKTEKAMSAVSKQMKESSSAADSAASSMDEFADASSKASGELSDTRKAASELKKAMDGVDDSAKSASSALKSAGDSAKKTEDSCRDAEDSTRSLGDSFDEANRRAADFGGRFGDVRSRLGEIEDAFKVFSGLALFELGSALVEGAKQIAEWTDAGKAAKIQAEATSAAINGMVGKLKSLTNAANVGRDALFGLINAQIQQEVASKGLVETTAKIVDVQKRYAIALRELGIAENDASKNKYGYDESAVQLRSTVKSLQDELIKLNQEFDQQKASIGVANKLIETATKTIEKQGKVAKAAALNVKTFTNALRTGLDEIVSSLRAAANLIGRGGFDLRVFGSPEQLAMDAAIVDRRVSLIRNSGERQIAAQKLAHDRELEQARDAGLSTRDLIAQQESERIRLEEDIASERAARAAARAREELQEQVVEGVQQGVSGDEAGFDRAAWARIELAQLESDERIRIARDMGIELVGETDRRESEISDIMVKEAKRREKAERAAVQAKIAGVAAVLGSVASVAEAVGASERVIAGIEAGQLVADVAVQGFKAAESLAEQDYFGFVQHSAAAVLAGVAAAEKFKVAGGGGGGGSSGGASGGGGGGRGGGGRPVDPASVRGERARTEPRETVVNVNMGARPFSTRRDVEEGVLEAIDGGSRRLGRRRLNLRRLMR